MKSNWVRFLIVAVIGFGLGVTLALFQVKNQTVSPVSSSASGDTSAESPAAIAVEPPVLEGAPPMPETAHVHVAPVAAPAVAGVQVGGAFSLTDHQGNAVTEKSWPGKYKLVFFGFTNCPDICPAALQKISAVMENYDAQGEKLAPLFITVDPQRDTQPVMAAYVGGYNPHILGLTGTSEQIKAAEDSYKVYAARAMETPAGDYMMDHSAYIYLMSLDDRLLEVFGSDETAESMIAKIRLHL